MIGKQKGYTFGKKTFLNIRVNHKINAGKQEQVACSVGLP